MSDNATAALNPRQKRFVAALVSTPTVREAASVAEIGEATAWRYLQEPSVRTALTERQDAALTQATAGLVNDMAQAREVLRTLMADKTIAPRTRVSAAKAVLDCGLRLFEMLALADRVAALEATMEE